MYRMILNETSYFGAGCREAIATEAGRRGFKKAFFVTDKDLIRFHVADKVVEVFEKAGIPYEIYSDVKANPTIAVRRLGFYARCGAKDTPPLPMYRMVWQLSRLPVPTLSLHWVAVLPLTRLKVSVS